MTGRIFDIQRFSIHDGPGIRTTVFLKGCPLHCLWCHNPEGIDPRPALSCLPDKCIGCGECFKVCKDGALNAGKPVALGPRAVLDRPRCTNCGACGKVCDTKALEMVGRDVTVRDVMDVVLRDREYYAASGGGITLSGGEPLFQPEFAAALLAAARAAGLHTAVETSGFAEWSAVERLRPVTDLFLYDCKETSPQLHESFTGKSNDRIRDNLRKLHAAGANIVLRCPLIPEYNARREHLDGIAALARELPGLKGVELLPYHRLGRAKLNRFGLFTRMPESVKPPERSVVAGWVEHLEKAGVRTVNQAAAVEASSKSF
ncbi:MAG: glycyl-radical enzyme activating protein [Acidobacteria bacterium]|nr:glycyl-radical enzyme activating protein [Acidobacteriota bacterium]